MKIRLNFVSNSSSTSFVCDISGEVHEIYDDDGRNEYWYECEHYHYVYAEPPDNFQINSDDQVLEAYCSACNGKKIPIGAIQSLINKVIDNQSAFIDFMLSHGIDIRKNYKLMETPHFKVLLIEYITENKVIPKVKKKLKHDISILNVR